MNCTSSRSVTNDSCVRISRRRMLASFTMISRAMSGSKRTSDDTVFSVLNRKCGLIWLCSASIRACISMRCCSSSFISIRRLFQILSGRPTHAAVVAYAASSTGQRLLVTQNSHFG